ncbi:hypothetical protein [uncultured Leifsonia sp.]|uniref:hypothetical protein n=1 Tax=uncultured Leifsonia sp. TaxID=340359 RepID=UPI0028D5FB9C|nr:hypothetical protein [uncultured Leifsonia sp.]
MTTATRTVDLDGLLSRLEDRTAEKIGTEPRVVLKDIDSFRLDELQIGPTWHRLTDIVAVSFDLKSSTNLEKGRSPQGTASIYDAGIGGVVRTLNDFGAEFVDIQGDGGFGLFWGRNAYTKAICAAVTIRSFSANFQQQIQDKWENLPSTGFKVGISSGPVMVKLVGLERHLDMQEPVWVGRPVNYATKAAQQTAPDNIVITGSVWDQIADNDYLAFSCGCGGGAVKSAVPGLLWTGREIDKIPDGQKYGLELGSTWCAHHGEEFCNLILSGATDRYDIPSSARAAREALSHGTELQAAAEERRSDRTRRFEELAEFRKAAAR